MRPQEGTQTGDGTRTVQVTGHGVVHAKPDTAVVDISFEDTKNQVTEARESVS